MTNCPDVASRCLLRKLTSFRARYSKRVPFTRITLANGKLQSRYDVGLPLNYRSLGGFFSSLFFAELALALSPPALEWTKLQIRTRTGPMSDLGSQYGAQCFLSVIAYDTENVSSVFFFLHPQL